MRSVNPITATEQEVGPLTYLGHRLILAWYCFFMVTMVLPYLLYGEVRDAFLRAVKHDVVWVQETQSVHLRRSLPQPLARRH